MPAAKTSLQLPLGLQYSEPVAAVIAAAATKSASNEHGAFEIAKQKTDDDTAHFRFVDPEL